MASFRFDIIGRPTYESHFDGGFTATEYDGLSTRSIRWVLHQSNPQPTPHTTQAVTS